MNNHNKNVHHQSGNEFSLFVGDLPHDCSDETLQRLFQSKFKSVKRVQIIRNEDGSSRGFGFIRFEDQTDFQAALSLEMKIGNNTLRIDEAHRFGNRGRYNSFNSTVSNNSNHHNHHHFNNSNSNLHHQHHRNQSHHHHQHHNPHHHPHSHRHQHNKQQNQTASGINNNNNNKALLSSDQTPGIQQLTQQSSNEQAGGRNNSSITNKNHSNPPHGTGAPGPSQHQPPQSQQQSSSQQHHNSHLGHNIFNSNPQKNTNISNNNSSNNTNQPSPDTKQGSKQANLSLSGDDSVKRSPNQSQSQPLVTQQPSQPLVPSQASHPTINQTPQPQHTLPTVPNPVDGQVAGSTITASSTATATTTMPITSVNHTVASTAVAAAAAAMHNSQQNLNTTTHQQAIGPDLRSYVPPAMIDSHMIGSNDQPSVVPPTGFYGHMYPYGPPPPFGYMQPPPQPNPVMPISAVPPAPPNSSMPTAGVGQQQISMAAGAVNSNRFSSGQQHHHNQAHHHHHPHQPQQPQQPGAHVPQAGVDPGGMGAMPGGVQAPHQAPFYYYYPNPMYFYFH